MQFEPIFIKEQMNIKWHCENGLIENIQKIIEEYRIQRNLTVNKNFLKIRFFFLNLFLSRLKYVFLVHQHLVKQQ